MQWDRNCPLEMNWLEDKGEQVMNPSFNTGVSCVFNLVSGRYESWFSAKNPATYCTIIHTGPSASSLWNVTLKVTIVVKPVRTSRNKPPLSMSFDFVLSHENNKKRLNLWRSGELKPYANKDNKLILTVSLDVVETVGLHCSLNRDSIEHLKKSLNGILVVEGRKIAVNKDFLSAESLFFEDVFNGVLGAKRSGIPLQDVTYDQFVCLMGVLYGFQQISITTYKFLLELSERFEMLKVQTMCEAFIVEDKDKYFTSSPYRRTITLELADQYNLTTVKVILNACIESLDDLKKLSDSCDFKKMSPTNQTFVLKSFLDKLCSNQ